MSGTMSRADLLADLRGMLNKSAAMFTSDDDADLNRHLDIAAADLARWRPRTLAASLTVTADVYEYDPPADLVVPVAPLWGVNEKRATPPWDRNAPGRLPHLKLVEVAGARKLHLEPAPTARQITLLGATYRYYYRAAHKVDADPAATTVAADDRPLLLLRAAAQAMLELAQRNVNVPVTLGAGVGVPAANGTPAALHDTLMKHVQAMGARAA